MSDTKARFVAAGERLFARDGIHRATVKALNEAAGQRNASALHYHFGGRDGLLRAIVAKHQAVVDVDRAERLAALGDEPSLDQLVGVVLAPLAERLRSPSGRDYLRIVPQLLHMEGFKPAALGQAMDLLAGHLPAELRAHRQRSMLLAATALLADRAATKRPALPHDVFVADLVAMATGMLRA